MRCICCLLLALFASRAHAQEPDAWYRTLLAALVKGDTAAVHRMSTPDYAFVVDGHVYTQAERLVDLAAPRDQPVISITPTCTWHRHDPVAIGVCHVLQRNAARDTMPASEWHGLTLVTLLRQGSDWRIAANSLMEDSTSDTH